MTIRLHVSSVFVDDQEHALRFYTDVLGFEPRTDVPLGNGDRWLTVGAPGQDVELLLEPSGHPAVKPYREALAEDGIPLASFAVDDVHEVHDRLVQAGVSFTQPPAEMGPVTTAVFDDTCGNLIQLITRPTDGG
ncbi:MAG TPA: VOC family protein [Acidimicrobiales bacterium]|nr:VOC family protein [Acidimicrobiales bacterium]